MAEHRLFDGTNGPTGTGNIGEPLVAGVEFRLDTTGCWVSELHYWRETSDGVTASRAGIYEVTDGSSGTLVDGTDVDVPAPDGATGWVTVALPQPVRLDLSQHYRAVFSYDADYPNIDNFWIDGDGAGGITSGPLYAPDESDAIDGDQGPFLESADGSLVYPSNGNGSNYGVDLTAIDEHPAAVRAASTSSAHVEPGTVQDVALAEAVSAAHRRPLARLRVDWSSDGYQHESADLTSWITELELESGLESELPSEATLAEGYQSESMTATLAGYRHGDTLSAVETLSLYRPDSPLHRRVLLGRDVALDLGMATEGGPRRDRAFTGTLRSIAPSSGDGQVDIEALGMSDRMRAPITLPVYGQLRRDIRGEGEADHPWTVNAQWVLDYILRANGIWPSPAPRDGCVLYATGHGSLSANLGWNRPPRGTWNRDDFAWETGPYGQLATPGHFGSGSYAEIYAAEQLTLRAGERINCSFWVKSGPVGDSTGRASQFVLIPGMNNVDDLAIVIKFAETGEFSFHISTESDQSTTYYVSASQEHDDVRWRFVSLSIRFDQGGTGRADVRYDGATTGWDQVDTLINPESFPWARRMQTTIFHNVPWSDFQIWPGDWTDDPSTWREESHVSEADLDPGLSELDYLPDVSGEDSWDLIGEIVQAEFGVAGFDPNGRFFFRNQQRTANPEAVEREVTAARGLKNLGMEMTTDSVRNVITWEIQGGGLSEEKTVIESEAESQFQTPVGVHSHEVSLPALTIFPPTSIDGYAQADWDDEIVDGFTVVDAVNPGTAADETAVSIDKIQLGSHRAALRVRNYDDVTVQFSSTDGDPQLRASGWQITEDNITTGEERAGGSIDTYGERTLELDSNRWRQRAGAVAPIARRLLQSLRNPTPTIEDIDIVGDPRLRNGQVIRIKDPQGIAPDLRAYIVKITHKIGASYEQTLSIRPIVSPGLGLLDDTELGLLDDTMVLAP